MNLHYLCGSLKIDIIIKIIMNSFENIKVAVAGTGYVGLSIATSLA